MARVLAQLAKSLLAAWALTLFSATLAASAEPAPVPHVERIDISEYGIYVDRSTATVASARTATGYVRHVTDIAHVETTDQICARIGVTFGMRFEVIGSPKGTAVTLDWVTRFPDPGVLVPQAAPGQTQRVRESRHASPVLIGEVSYRSYMLEYGWEIVPGTWSFEFYFQGRKVGQKSFVVMQSCPIS